MTPRRGKAVEINALWYNALRADGALAAASSRRRRRRARAGAARASGARARRSTARFWYAGRRLPLRRRRRRRTADDPACRPNQLFAISLPHPVLDRGALAGRCSTWSSEQLLTPVGLRSLAPGDPDYKPTLRRRPARARRRLSPGHGVGLADRPVRRRAGCKRAARTTAPARAAARRPRRRTSSEACVGSISEIFDAEPPFTPRGCIAQAWSVAEVLRAMVACGQD